MIVSLILDRRSLPSVKMGWSGGGDGAEGWGGESRKVGRGGGRSAATGFQLDNSNMQIVEIWLAI